mgnify:FL=1
MKREQDIRSTQSNQPVSTLPSTLQSVLLALGEKTAERVGVRWCWVLLGTVGVQTVVSNHGLGQSWVVRLDSFYLAALPELLIVVLTLLLLLFVLLSADRTTSTRSRAAVLSNTITTSSTDITTDTCDTKTQGILAALVYLLPLLTCLCTSRLLALLAIGVADIVEGGGSSRGLQMGALEVVVLSATAVVSVVLAMGYLSLILTPLPTRMPISCSHHTWLYILLCIPGLALLTHIFLLPSSHPPSSLTSTMYLLCRTLPFVATLFCLRTTFFYHPHIHRTTQLALAAIGGLVAAQAVHTVFEDDMRMRCELTVVCVFSTACTMWHTAEDEEDWWSAFDPTSLRDVLAVASSSLDWLHSSHTSPHKSLHTMVHARQKSIRQQLTHLVHRNRLYRRTASKESSQPGAENEPSLTEMNQLLVEAVFEAHLSSRSSHTQLAELVYLSLLTRSASGYSRMVQLIGKLKGSCGGSFRWELYLKRVVRNLNAVDLDNYSSKFNYDIHSNEKIQFETKSSFECSYSINHHTKSSIDARNILINLSSLQMFDELV